MDQVVQEIVRKYWEQLKKKKNVRYYSGTLKPRVKDDGTVLTTQPCFRIYVTEKEDLKALSKKDIIPRKLKVDGRKIGMSNPGFCVETDVYPIGEIKIEEVCRTRDRPVKAGCSAMNYQGTACTLGWFGINKKAGESEFIGVVCNNHCGARENKAAKGEAYLYPSPYDGGTMDDKIAEHWRHVELKFNGFTCPVRDFFHKLFRLFKRAEVNPVDSSFEKLSISLDEVTYEIFKIGAIKGKRRGVLGETAKGTGRTNGLRTGAKLIDNDWYGEVQYGRGSIMRGPNILLEGKNFSAGGDSSKAVLWEKDDYLGGLLYGGSDTHSVADHYDLIEKYLEVELIVP